MWALLREIACAWALVQILLPHGAAAQDDQYRYAVLLTAPKVREAFHCPYCNGSVSVVAGSTYVVRTGEGINLAFDDLVAASRAVELLNWMARAGDQCERDEYQDAVGEYMKLMALNSAPQQTALETSGLFTLLNPKRELSPLAEYVLPIFHRCGVQRLTRAKLSVNRHPQAGLRLWMRRSPARRTSCEPAKG